MEPQEIQNPFKKKNEKQQKFHQDKKEKDPKGPPLQKIDSVFIAREIIIGNEEFIGKWLLEFRKIKSANYDKFTDRILDNLVKGNFTFRESINRLMAISGSATDDNTTGHQMEAILNAFYSNWKYCQLVEQHIFDLFYFIQQMYVHISKKFITYYCHLMRTRFQHRWPQFQHQALSLVNKLIKNNRNDEYKILPLIYEFDLYGDIPLGKILELVLRTNNVTDIIYVFQTKKKEVRMNLLNMFVDRCTNRGDKSDMTKCQTLIRKLELNPFQFGDYIQKMQEKYINYLTRSYKLYCIELIICHDRILICLLIEELRRQRRSRQMHYFIVKYGLQQDYNYNFSKDERYSILGIRNILLDNDYFGPTEVEVLQQIGQEEEKKFLYMADYGMNQQDVIVITSHNIEQLNYKAAFNDRIGIDEERGGGTHVFDPSNTSTIQIYNGKTVYIFDTQQLGNHPQIRNIFTHIFLHCHIYGQQVIKELTQMQKKMNLEVDEQKMQEMTKNRVTDSSKLFKKVFPKEKKSSLAFQCDFLFKKTLSKYQQCSGWIRRPLRKAQLHYAALDSILPYKICEHLLKLKNEK